MHLSNIYVAVSTYKSTFDSKLKAQHHQNRQILAHVYAYAFWPLHVQSTYNLKIADKHRRLAKTKNFPNNLKASRFPVLTRTKPDDFRVVWVQVMVIYIVKSGSGCAKAGSQCRK